MRSLLPYLQKASHYAGLEDGCVIKPGNGITLRIGLAFPDVYEVGMSYLGQKILYNILNSQPHWQAERVFAPEKETSVLLKEKNIRLGTLESGIPLSDLDVLGISVTHELCFTDILHILDLGGIPFRHVDRPENLEKCPLIIAGGGAMAGAEPISPFFDLVCLGDGEELLPELLHLFEKAKSAKTLRSEFLLLASEIPGVYVPSLFSMNPDGSLHPLKAGYRPVRRIVADLNKAEYPVNQIAPIGAVHNRLTLEIARGCTRGCRFCHAGMTYRPVRERNPENLKDLMEKALDKTGFEEVSFLSLSTGDFSALKTFWSMAWDRCVKEHITLSLPSLRVGSVDQEVMEKMALLGRTGCTLAPEAGSQRLRDVINKGITEQALLDHARKLLENGWRQVKLYFMIGLPSETDADLDAILQLCQKVRDIGGKGSPRLSVTASISPFVPKPFTPFQWEAQISLPEMQRRIDYCKGIFYRQKQIVLRWHQPESSHLEGILSRADRRMADVIEKAYAKGAIFTGWAEHFELEPWLSALQEANIDIDALTGSRLLDQPLPWDHLEIGIDKNFLLKERSKALKEEVTEDCRYGKCGNCGICDLKNFPSLLTVPGKTEKYSHRLVFQQRDQQGDAFLKNTQQVFAKPARPMINKNLVSNKHYYRIWHRKLGAYSYLSQLELQAVIWRLLRRAHVPVAFSQGYHPLPLLSFGKALPVGIGSDAEWFGLALHEYVSPQNLMVKLNKFLPNEMKVWQTDISDKKSRTEQAVSETFFVNLANNDYMEKIINAFTDFSGLEKYIIEKETKKEIKSIDLRALLAHWKIISGPTGSGVLFTTDWSRAYLSPMQFLQKILAQSGYSELTALKPVIIKRKQIFENGREFFPPDCNNTSGTISY